MESGFIRVADVMRTELHMIDGLASVQSAIEEMNRLKVSSLVIEHRHEGDEYGIVTVKDIAAKVVAVNRSTERASVYQIMTKPALTISADMNVKYAIRLLARLEHNRALVTNAKDLIGLASLRDLVLSYADHEKSAD